MKLNKFWFRPKKYGYGAYPSSWEGWAVVAFFVIYMLSLTTIVEKHTTLYFILFILGVWVLIMISVKKTDGKWAWHWGSK